MTIGATAPTLLDFAKREDMMGKITEIIEVIEPTNEIIQDIPWVEGNLPTGHKTTVRSGYPTPTWRLLNYGVQPTKSQTTQVTDSCGMLEAYAEVDKDLADLNGNSAAWRLSENKAHLIGMGTTLASAIFYGNQAIDPEKITGFSPRYTSPVVTNDAAGFNMIDGGAADGQTDCLSIWLVGWGENTCHGIYPKGSKSVGWTNRDLGEQTLYDSQTPPGRYQGYRSHYKWDVGLTVRDWRYVVRICNIDSSLLTRDAATGPDILSLMVQALERVADLNSARFAFYVPRKIRSYLRSQEIAKVKGGGGLTFENINGRHVLNFEGIPVRRCDSLVTETAILDAAGTFADV
jgi:hypothetical protein